MNAKFFILVIGELMQVEPQSNRKLSRDFVVLLLAQTLIQAVTAFTGIIIARTFTPVQYAAYTLAFTGLNIAMLLSDFGLTQFVSREAALIDNKQALKLWQTALRIRLTLSCISIWLILIITWLWSAAGSPFLSLIAGLTLFPSAVAILSTAILNAQGKTARSAGLNSLASLLNALFLLIALWLWQDVAAVLTAGVIAACLSATLLGLSAYQKLKTSSPTSPPASPHPQTVYTTPSLLTIGLTFLWLNLASLIFQYADIYIVSAFVPPTELGWYSAALRLTGLVTVIATVWGIAALPRFSKLYAKNDPLEKTLSRKWTLILTFCGISLAILLLMFAEVVVKIFLGSNYLPAVPLVAILGWYTAAIFTGTVAVNRLIAQGNQKRVAIVLGVSGFVSLILTLILLGSFNLGVVGAAFAKTGGAWLLTIGYFLVNMRPLRKY
jgi:O-antigen/teichoic acid export membrane protein